MWSGCETHLETFDEFSANFYAFLVQFEDFLKNVDDFDAFLKD